MSLINHYKQPVVRRYNEATAAATTITIWTPVSGRRIILEGLDISNIGNTTTTLKVYFGPAGALRGPTTVATYSLGTTATIYPRFAGLESSADATLIAVEGAASLVAITSYGFEIE